MPGAAGCDAAAKVGSIKAGFLTALTVLAPMLTGRDDHRDAARKTGGIGMKAMTGFAPKKNVDEAALRSCAADWAMFTD